MPIGVIVMFSLLASAIAGVATYVVTTLVREALLRRAHARVPADERTRTDVLALPDAAALEAEPSIDLRLAWHLARAARSTRFEQR